MAKVRMFHLTRLGGKRHHIGNLRESDLTTHAAPGTGIQDRLRYELAQMAGGNIARSILRGVVTQYSDGSYSVGPRDAKGKRSVTEKGNLITFWATPYDFDPETSLETKP